MQFKELKEQLFLPKKEYIINQWANIRGIDVLLLSLTVGEDKNCLWLAYVNDELDVNSFISEEYQEEIKTNRQELLNNIENSKKHKSIHINKMEIQGQTVTFTSSCCGPIYDWNVEDKLLLQHFVEKGLIPKEWDEVNVENIYIGRYEQMEGETSPNIDRSKDLSVVLHIAKSSAEIPIQYPFNIYFGKQPVGTKITYYDEELKGENFFYIDEIYAYDIYKEVEKGVQQISDRKERKKVLKDLVKTMRRICPIDKNMAVIKYETADNIQLRFMTRDYLESEPAYSNTGVAIGLASNKDEIGINGYKVRHCLLKPISKDFNGILELELFSKIVEIPEEVVICSR